MLSVLFFLIRSEILAHHLAKSSEAVYISRVIDISSNVPKILASHSIEQGNIRLLSTLRRSAFSSSVIVMYSKDNQVFTAILKSDGTVEIPTRVPLLPDAQSVFLYGRDGGYLCFMQSEQLLFSSYNPKINLWSHLLPMTEILNGNITSVVEDRKGGIIAFCNGEHIKMVADLVRPIWSLESCGVIYYMRSIDGGLSWSSPRMALKHNLLQLHNALVVIVPAKSGSKNMAIVHEKLSGKALYSLGSEDDAWSYPRFFADNFAGEVLSLYVTGRRINVVYRYLSSIYQWRGTIENMERSGLYHGAKLIMRYSPDNEHIISVVPAGKGLLYVFAIRSA